MTEFTVWFDQLCTWKKTLELVSYRQIPMERSELTSWNKQPLPENTDKIEVCTRPITIYVNASLFKKERVAHENYKRTTHSIKKETVNLHNPELTDCIHNFRQSPVSNHISRLSAGNNTRFTMRHLGIAVVVWLKWIGVINSNESRILTYLSKTMKLHEYSLHYTLLLLSSCVELIFLLQNGYFTILYLGWCRSRYYISYGRS